MTHLDAIEVQEIKSPTLDALEKRLGDKIAEVEAVAVNNGDDVDGLTKRVRALEAAVAVLLSPPPVSTPPPTLPEQPTPDVLAPTPEV
jgi:hypothetical protein